MKTSRSRTAAATTPSDMIESGSPEEAYQAINRAKMLWSFRRRDIDDWKNVIDRWAKEPKAWHRIPEMSPYGTAKAMIEAEVCENYEAFVEFIKEIVGASYAAKLADNHGDRPGPREGTVNNPNRSESGKFTSANTHHNGYVHNHYGESARRGTNSTYLLERIAKESPETTELIGKGKQFKTVHEAAKSLGIVKDRPRVSIYVDDPISAARALAKHVDADWVLEFYDAFMKELE